MMIKPTNTFFDELDILETPITPGKQENTNIKATPDKLKKNSQKVTFDIYKNYQPDPLYFIIENEDFGYGDSIYLDFSFEKLDKLNEKDYIRERTMIFT